jgi:hypothetical protein
MRLRYLRTALGLTARDLLRSRMVVLLLLIIPTLFLGLVVLTAGKSRVGFKLAAAAGQPIVAVSERDESLIFVAAAAAGLLASYLALGLIQRHRQTQRRLILCGYRPTELVGAKLAVLVAVSVLIAGYVTALLAVVLRPERIWLLALGMVLAGLVYGCYGLLVGAIFHRELEGILFVVLLANIDAGWLQNPLYYAGAQNQAIIRALPAYFPTQLSMIGAFTHHAWLKALLGSLAYAVVLLLLALVLYFLGMRTRPPLAAPLE